MVGRLASAESTPATVPKTRNGTASAVLAAESAGWRAPGRVGVSDGALGDTRRSECARTLESAFLCQRPKRTAPVRMAILGRTSHRSPVERSARRRSRPVARGRDGGGRTTERGLYAVARRSRSVVGRRSPRPRMVIDCARSVGGINVTLQVPARCHIGHHLEPRTVYVRHTGATASRSGLTPVGWECVVCVRVACWRAQFPNQTVPAELLEPESYKRQLEGVFRSRMPKFTSAVDFQSGWQFSDPDSTPAERAERQRTAAENERRKVARREREQQDAEDRRAREIRREQADESLRSIRALMGAAS